VLSMIALLGGLEALKHGADGAAAMRILEC
jgi:hypothetical protein